MVSIYLANNWTWKKDTLRGDLELCGLVVGICGYLWDPSIICGYLWDPLEKEMATHSSILAWRIPQTEEPGRLQSMGLQRVGHDWASSLWGPSSHTMVFPVVLYGYESWTIKKAECWRTDAFELWCWRRLLRVPWTARRSNQSILKEISPE